MVVEKMLKDLLEWLTQIDADILRGQFIDPHRNKISLEEFKELVGIVKLNQAESTKEILKMLIKIFRKVLIYLTPVLS